MSSASLYNLQREGKEPRVEQSPQLLVQSFSRGRWYKQLPPRDRFSACFFPFCAECFKHQKENKLRESSSSEGIYKYLVPWPPGSGWSTGHWQAAFTQSTMEIITSGFPKLKV